eukprot:Pgem_evm4s2062
MNTSIAFSIPKTNYDQIVVLNQIDPRIKIGSKLNFGSIFIGEVVSIYKSQSMIKIKNIDDINMQ